MVSVSKLENNHPRRFLSYRLNVLLVPLKLLWVSERNLRVHFRVRFGNDEFPKSSLFDAVPAHGTLGLAIVSHSSQHSDTRTAKYVLTWYSNGIIPIGSCPLSRFGRCDVR